MPNQNQQGYFIQLTFETSFQQQNQFKLKDKESKQKVFTLMCLNKPRVHLF